MFHLLELKFIHFIHQFRNPIFDQFFKALDFFDRQEFFFVLIPIIWLVKGWKSGLKLFYILILSLFINQVLKGIFLLPRPFHIDQNVGIIRVGGFGFPSGAAQTVILLSGMLLSNLQRFWKWPLVIFYISLISFSRVYLGLHFPSDIIGGWLVGFGLWMIYQYIFPSIEKQLEKFKPTSLFLLSQIFPIVLLICHFTIPSLRLCGVAMGIGIGLYISYLFNIFLPASQNLKESIIRSSIGLLGIFIVYYSSLFVLNSNSFHGVFLQFLFIGAWLGVGSHFICNSFLFKKFVEEISPTS